MREKLSAKADSFFLRHKDRKWKGLMKSCTSSLHKDKDVEKYIKENISESPFLKKTDSDGLDKTRHWKLSFDDKPDYLFYVYSGFVSNSGVPQGIALRTNFNNIFQKYYLDKYTNENNSKLYSELYMFHNFPFEVYRIKCKYSSTEEAHILANDSRSTNTRMA